MNSYQQNLFDNLTHLVRTNEAFYTVDHEINGVTYRVFTYRMASYMDFYDNTDALECRGHMFRIEPRGVIELVSLPFEKFFNLNENPYTMDLDVSEVDFIHDKRDGSLITTYEHEGTVRLKSKTSLSSDQALDSMRLLHADVELTNLLHHIVLGGDSSVSFEYTSPDNRIVLPYQTHELRVLGSRSLTNGKYMSYDILYDYFGDYMTDDHSHHGDNAEAFLARIPDMKGIEGFVVGLKSGQRFKVKTSEYLSLHRAKDSVNSNKRLFEVCLNEASDDLRSLFVDDPYTLEKITDMENRVGHVYNSMVQLVEDYHTENGHLDRKSYAVKGQVELDKIAFGLAMCKYVGREPDYRARIMSNFKLYVEDNDAKV
jgi:T4 RnlA family RNA ligase